MKKYVALFVLGIASALSIPLILDVIQTGEADKESISDFVHSIKEIDKITKGGYYFLYLIILPFAAIPILKKRLTGKWSLLYTYFVGNTFGFSIIGLIGVFS